MKKLKRKRCKRSPKGQKQRGFVTKYIHYRTDEIMFAPDYGYVAWPFGRMK